MWALVSQFIVSFTLTLFLAVSTSPTVWALDGDSETPVGGDEGTATGPLFRQLEEIPFFNCSNFSQDQKNAYYLGQTMFSIPRLSVLIIPNQVPLEVLATSEVTFRALRQPILAWVDPWTSLEEVYTTDAISAEGQDNLETGHRHIDLSAASIAVCRECYIEWSFENGEKYCSSNRLTYANNSGHSTKVGNAGTQPDPTATSGNSADQYYVQNGADTGFGCGLMRTPTNQSSMNLIFLISIFFAMGGLLWRCKR